MPRLWLVGMNACSPLELARPARAQAGDSSWGGPDRAAAPIAPDLGARYVAIAAAPLRGGQTQKGDHQQDALFPPKAGKPMMCLRCSCLE